MIEPDHGATSRAWSWRHAVAKSGLPPITRLVLHTLGLKMDATGGSCYPSLVDLCDLSGLDKKTIIKHLDLAEEKGWIEVSQHGFRGQKWKRNEYVARWPGRDLVGETAKISDEAGVSAPPPCAQKVVEMVPEGGGAGSQKVVEEIHQDKILPNNSPENSPAAVAAEGEKSVRKDFKKIEAEFWALVKDWPNFETAGKDRPRKLWFALDDEERRLAIERFPAWRASFGNRKNITMPSTYLGEKLWTTVEPPVPASERVAACNAFSRAWSARRLFLLLAEPVNPRTPPTAFQAAQLKAGGEAAQAIMRERRRNYGWPAVDRMHERALAAEGVVVEPWLIRISEGFEKAHRDGERAAAWRDYQDRMGWPVLPEKVEWLFFPAGDTPESAMEAFKAAVEGAGR